MVTFLRCASLLAVAAHTELVGAQWSEEEMMEVRLLQTKQQVSKKALNGEGDSDSIVTVSADSITRAHEVDSTALDAGVFEAKSAAEVDSVEADEAGTNQVTENTDVTLLKLDHQLDEHMDALMVKFSGVIDKKLAALESKLDEKFEDSSKRDNPVQQASPRTFQTEAFAISARSAQIPVSDACEAACTGTRNTLDELVSNPPITGANERFCHIMFVMLCIEDHQSGSCSDVRVTERSDFRSLLDQCREAGYSSALRFGPSSLVLLLLFMIFGLGH